MDPLEFCYFKRLAQETTSNHKYLEEWDKLSDQDKKISMQQNKQFWDDLFDESKLTEDPIPPKSPDLTNSIDPQFINNLFELPQIQFISIE